MLKDMGKIFWMTAPPSSFVLYRVVGRPARPGNSNWRKLVIWNKTENCTPTQMAKDAGTHRRQSHRHSSTETSRATQRQRHRQADRCRVVARIWLQPSTHLWDKGQCHFRTSASEYAQLPCCFDAFRLIMYLSQHIFHAILIHSPLCHVVSKLPLSHQGLFKLFLHSKKYTEYHSLWDNSSNGTKAFNWQP